MAFWSSDRSRQARARFEREAMPHLDAAYRFARSLTRDAAEADDLVQETFVKALAAFDTYQDGTNCKAWLFRILRNTFINQVRARRHEVVVDEVPEGIGGLSGWADAPAFRDPQAAVLLAATRDQIEAALEGLPPDFRSAVVLSDVEGLTYQEIADVMGTPIGTVMSRLYRGRRLMRERLVCGEPGAGREAADPQAPEAGGRLLSLVGARRAGGGRDGL